MLDPFKPEKKDEVVSLELFKKVYMKTLKIL